MVEDKNKQEGNWKLGGQDFGGKGSVSENRFICRQREVSWKGLPENHAREAEKRK